jgi:hypothetical protein
MRVHDQTVADDYYVAMDQVEKRLDLLGLPEDLSTPILGSERSQLLGLIPQAAEPGLVLYSIRLDAIRPNVLVLFLTGPIVAIASSPLNMTVVRDTL